MTKRCEGELSFSVVLGDCERIPIVERDGKSYCWKHDPELAKIQNEETKHKFKRAILLEKSGVNELTDDDLDLIIEFGGIKELIEYRCDREG